MENRAGNTDAPTQIIEEWATMAEFVFAVWAFHSVMPLGVEAGKLLMAVPRF